MSLRSRYPSPDGLEVCRNKYWEILVKGKTILRRAIDGIRRISGVFSPTEPAIQFNPVLAKWEQHYEARPNSFARRRQNSTLSYLTPAD